MVDYVGTTVGAIGVCANSFPGGGVVMEDKKTDRLAIRVTPEQKRQIEDKARLVGLSPSAYLRMLVATHKGVTMVTETRRERE